jgi:hypothetical protein
MNDATRVTWAGVFLTLGGTMAAGFVLRWLVWWANDGSGGHPQVLWTLGFLALGALLVALQLFIPAMRHQNEVDRTRRAAEDGY